MTPTDAGFNPPDADWEARCAALWSTLADAEPARFVAHVDALAAALPAGHPIGLFERAGARDSTGRTDEAVPLYRAARAAGLGGLRRRRAAIQLASSLRVLGAPAEAAALLEDEARQPADALDAAVAAFHALALADLGREREALSRALTALAPLLPRYQQSLARYAQALMPDASREPPPAAAVSHGLPAAASRGLPAAAAPRPGPADDDADAGRR